MNPLNATVRRVLYIVGVVGGLAVTWALAKGWIDAADGAFATGVLAVLNGLAAAKTEDTAPTVVNVTSGAPLVAHSSDTKADATYHGSTRYQYGNAAKNDGSTGGCE